MKTTVKRGSKKRLKSVKEAKRDLLRASTKKFPITETINWVRDGEELLRKWGAIKSPGAKRIANTVSKLLGMLETLNELRKM